MLTFMAIRRLFLSTERSTTSPPHIFFSSPAFFGGCYLSVSEKTFLKRLSLLQFLRRKEKVCTRCMTSASELFHNRSSRLDRKNVKLGFESSMDRTFHHSHGNRRHFHSTRSYRHGLFGFDPFRISPRLRHPSHRPSHSENESVQIEQASSQSAAADIVSSENFSNIRNRLRSSGNDGLPGTVLLARERLLERLRSVSLSENRRSNRASSGINPNDFRLVDAGNRETEISREWQAGGIPYTDSIIQTDRLLVREGTSKRPPGLTKEALDCLHLEVFSKMENNDEGTIISRASWECRYMSGEFPGGR
ncbi:hypothetical protein F0562_020755 [Nyssa sinensis]|uniref:Uncharacterized protein n=1 Tax=Nyssa sinensis TaxID=561372 RepID=A0A5J5BT00_9ASTE|nr:hypothetical protein F0562_020755 [Nyssa sinensis]